jgi:hypothetical protein
MNRLSKILLSFVGIIFAAAPGILQYLATAASPETVAKFIKDDFAIDCLRTVVSWSGYEFLSGVAFAVVLAVAIFYLRGLKQMLVIYGNTALYTLVLLIILVPRIEKYSQGPAIAFISSFKGNPAWVSTLGYKSYAPYFYSAKPSRACAADADEQEFLLHGDTTREVYFVVKSTASNSILKQYPNLKFVAKNGGFVLLKRTGNGNDPH